MILVREGSEVQRAALGRIPKQKWVLHPSREFVSYQMEAFPMGRFGEPNAAQRETMTYQSPIADQLSRRLKSSTSTRQESSGEVHAATSGTKTGENTGKMQLQRATSSLLPAASRAPSSPQSGDLEEKVPQPINSRCKIPESFAPPRSKPKRRGGKNRNARKAIKKRQNFQRVENLEKQLVKAEDRVRELEGLGKAIESDQPGTRQVQVDNPSDTPAYESAPRPPGPLRLLRPHCSPDSTTKPPREVFLEDLHESWDELSVEKGGEDDETDLEGEPDIWPRFVETDSSHSSDDHVVLVNQQGELERFLVVDEV